MLQVSVQHNLQEVMRDLERVRQEQVPFATAKALTDTAGDVKKGLREEMPRAFDRPTPFTLNALYTRPATKRDLRAYVWIKDDAGKGTPAVKFLAPNIYGGDRRNKRFEAALVRSGIMASGYVAVPGGGAKIDSYGNVSRGQIVQILSALKAFGETGYLANRTAASKKRKGRNAPEYFVSRGGHLAYGIWQRFTFAAGSAVKPVFLFVKGASYRKRYDFFGIGERIVQRRFSENFKAAMQYAMATAR